MPANFVVNGGTVTIRFLWPNVPTARAQEIVNYAALYDHGRGLGPTEEVDGEQVQVPFDELTSQQKLTMNFQAAQRLLIAQAKTGYINEQQNTARDTAAEYVDGEYALG